MRFSFSLLLLILAVAAFWTTVPSGCATIVPPTGGDRDSTAPVLLTVTPGDSSVNFRGNRITFTFDELVELKTQQNPVTISPNIEGYLEPRANSRTLTVRIAGDTALEANITYIINFGDALVDVHEGNPLRNFSYVFSTGPVLDSLEISGRVQLAETGEVDSTLSVALYRDLGDSAIYLQRPLYVTKLDRNGAFTFGNLPGSLFNVFVLQNPVAPNRTDSTSLFGFLNAPVRSGEADSLVLFAFRAAQPRTPGGTPALPVTPRGAAGGVDRRLRYTVGNTGTQDLLSDFTLNFPVPLRSFDSAKLRLTTDTTAFTPVPFSARLDSTRKQLSISTPWIENTAYNLELQQDFATDTAGRQLLKTDTLYFATKAEAEYGNLILRFRNLDLSRKPVLLLVQNNAVVGSLPLTSNVVTRPRFLPGDYSLRLLYDTNGDGRWTPGNFRLRRQPELVRPIDRSISVKAAWDNEFEIAL